MKLRYVLAALVVVMSSVSAATGAVAAAAPTAGVTAPVRAAEIPQPARPPAAGAAGLAYGSFDVFQTWTMRGARPSLIQSGRFKGRCTLTVSILTQEIGKHGVVRLKADFELRGPNAPGWTGWVLHTGYLASRYFPDNQTSYHTTFSLPAGYFRYPQNLVFSLWIKTVGERFGFPDYTRHYKLADVHCDESTPGSIDFGT